MKKRSITQALLLCYKAHLWQEERAANTVVKYMREVRGFALWLGDAEVTKASAAAWKEYLMQRGRSPASVNGALAALHSFFAFCGWSDCRVRYLKVQRRVFRDRSKELSREEYLRLVKAAERRGDTRLALLLETICATGVRVSEVPCITVEAVQRSRADISLKGKIRTVLIPGKLAKKLKKYAQKQKIAFGAIFITKNGKPMSRRQIWGQMKGLCRAAGVDESKVFPHNLRHLFARAFYKVCKDIVRLADVLGHSSVETTRIYLMTTGEEHSRTLDGLGLIL